MNYTKVCVKCGETKEASEYGKKASSSDGLNTSCGACYNKQAAVYHAKNREVRLEQQKAYRKRSELLDKKRRRDYYQRNRDKILIYQRAKQAENRDDLYARRKEWAKENIDKIISRNIARIKDVKRATPAWTDMAAIAEIYESARRKRIETKESWHVDHIVPIKGKVVCGLHCPANLQIIPAKDNMKKHNWSWPDMPEAE